VQAPQTPPRSATVLSLSPYARLKLFLRVFSRRKRAWTRWIIPPKLLKMGLDYAGEPHVDIEDSEQLLRLFQLKCPKKK
jgi:hypothetical protein